MSEKNTDSGQLKSLLTAYSLKDLTAFFTRVDEQIVSLHQVSSEDFMNLNRDFRDFHGQARQISDNASYLFHYITGNENAEMVAGIEKLYQELRSRTEILDGHIEVISEALTRLLSRLRQSFFPIKNFKQNLTSLKFLESNYELKIPFDQEREVPPMAIQEISEQLKAQLGSIETLLSKLKQMIRAHFELKEQFNRERSDIQNILTLLKREIESYSGHYQNIREHLPAIKTETQRSSENIAGIVTNLQYQDIIKQKMEHIQHTHKQLLEEISAMEQQEDQVDDQTKADYFIRIRDIAGLQAAQLMHTNKEYQTAIQKISDKFLEIGQSMTRVSAMCNQYIASDQGSPEFMSGLKQNLDQAKGQIESFCRFTRAFSDKRDEIQSILDQLKDGHERVNQYMQQLNDILKKTLTNGQTESKDDAIVQQISQLHGDLQNNQGLLTSIFEDYQTIRQELERDSMANLYDKGNGAEDLPGKIRAYLEKLGQIEQQILEKLKENNEKSEQIYSEVQNSVNRIQYYEYFENVIGDIIEQLNTVNYNLKLYSSYSGESKEENLQKLREYYTMSTEFKVHDSVSKGESPEIEAGEEGGDLELF